MLHRFDFFEPRYISSPDTRRYHWQQAYDTSLEHFPSHPRYLLGPPLQRLTIQTLGLSNGEEGFKQQVVLKMAQMKCWECRDGNRPRGSFEKEHESSNGRQNNGIKLCFDTHGQDHGCRADNNTIVSMGGQHGGEALTKKGCLDSSIGTVSHPTGLGWLGGAFWEGVVARFEALVGQTQ